MQRLNLILISPKPNRRRLKGKGNDFPPFIRNLNNSNLLMPEWQAIGVFVFIKYDLSILISDK